MEMMIDEADDKDSVVYIGENKTHECRRFVTIGGLGRLDKCLSTPRCTVKWFLAEQCIHIALLFDFDVQPMNPI